MRSGDLSDLPNPFAINSRRARARRRRPLYAAAKFLLLVVIGFGVTLVVGTQSRRWLVTRLTADFDSLPRTEKLERLVELSELGEPAIDPLVQALLDDNSDVARTSYELLRGLQNEWTTLPRTEITRRHQRLVASLSDRAEQLPDHRSGWATGLIQQTLMQTVQLDDPASKELYGRANEVLDRLLLSSRPGPSVLQAGSFESNVPVRLSVRAEPLPVVATAATRWTDWPPSDPRPDLAPPNPVADDAVDVPADFDRSRNSDRSRTSGNTDAPAGSGEPVERRDEASPSPAVANDPPSVYRSSLSPLRSLEPGETVQLREIEPARETSYQADQIQPVTRVVDSPMETYDDRSIFHWLASPHQVLREKARLELIRRGYDGSQIRLAAQLSAGDVETRLGVIDQLARSRSIDPRPWLLFLLDDSNRQVQLRAISVLATMDDPAIGTALRSRLNDQPDPIVAARLRRVLDLR